MKRTWVFGMAAWVVVGMAAWAQESAPTNVPAAAGSTQAVVEAAAPAAPAAPDGWVGYVRVLKEKGEVRAVRFVAGDKLLAVELNDKAQALAKQPRTQKMLVNGALEERDGRPWLIVSDFKAAPENLPPPAAAPVPPPPAPAVDTNAPAAAATNAPAAAATNAPAP